mmetsp:Transcript_13015/g.18793  ORF Transcript_13015/g.18793 Transcript_13015/m.18793 type:complete len:90 (+) Transcript_13015:962-1231(+)
MAAGMTPIGMPPIIGRKVLKYLGFAAPTGTDVRAPGCMYCGYPAAPAPVFSEAPIAIGGKAPIIAAGYVKIGGRAEAIGTGTRVCLMPC